MSLRDSTSDIKRTKIIGLNATKEDIESLSEREKHDVLLETLTRHYHQRTRAETDDDHDSVDTRPQSDASEDDTRQPNTSRQSDFSIDRRGLTGVVAKAARPVGTHQVIGTQNNALLATVDSSSVKSDIDILKESYRFIRTEEDDEKEIPWVLRMAKEYYAKLYREFAVADLSQHAQGKIALRWRTESELRSGKGQFECGEVYCGERHGLMSFEVPFAYKEAGERKQALVKVRLCPRHADELESVHRNRKNKRGRKYGDEEISRRSLRKKA